MWSHLPDGYGRPASKCILVKDCIIAFMAITTTTTTTSLPTLFIGRLMGPPPLPPLHFYKLLMCIKPSSSASTLALVPANLICSRSSKLVEPKSSVSKVLYDS